MLTLPRPSPVVQTILIVSLAYLCLPLYMTLFHKPLPVEPPGPPSSPELVDQQNEFNDTVPPLLPKLVKFAVILAGFLWSGTTFVLATLMHLVYAVLPFLLAVLDPILILAQMSFRTFVLVPINTVVGIIRILYPIYVFCGIACITGCAIGLVGRGIVGVSLRTISNGRKGKDSTYTVPPLDK